MPIQVVCPSCKTSFKVSDQFAGKQGPCPKCKAPIRIPKPEVASAAPPAAPAKQEGKANGQPPAKPGAKAAAPTPAMAPLEVKIHEADVSGPKTSTGRPVIKPILRKETNVQMVPIIMIAGGTLLAFAAAWLLRKPLAQQVGLRAVGLLLISPALTMGGYWFLRNDELEPYRGRALWLRGALCALVYAALWGAYLLLPADAATAAWSWIYLAPPFFLIGAGAAYATLDLDMENAFFHYCFYVLVTMALGYAAALHMPWQPVTRPRPGVRTTTINAVRHQSAGGNAGDANGGASLLVMNGPATAGQNGDAPRWEGAGILAYPNPAP
jgi:hypothetical protein